MRDLSYDEAATAIACGGLVDVLVSVKVGPIREARWEAWDNALDGTPTLFHPWGNAVFRIRKQDDA